MVFEVLKRNDIRLPAWRLACIANNKTASATYKKHAVIRWRTLEFILKLLVLLEYQGSVYRAVTSKKRPPTRVA